MIRVCKVPVIKKPGRRLRNTCGSIAFDLKKQLYNGLMNSAPPHGPSDDKVKKHFVVVFMVGLKVKYYCEGNVHDETVFVPLPWSPTAPK